MKKVIIVGFFILSGAIMITGGVISLTLSNYPIDLAEILLVIGIIIFTSSFVSLFYIEASD